MPYKDKAKQKECARLHWVKNKDRYRDEKRQRYQEMKDDPDFKLKKKVRELKLKYGLTLDQVKHMWISQSGSCAICKTVFEKRSDMRVDHNHTTNEVRQLLCNSCNTLLGLCYENPLILSSAIDYLNKWNVKN